MKKFLYQISALILAAFILCTGLVGCFKTKLPKLPTPEVVIGSDGVATWDKIDYTLYYIYVIDDDAEKYTDECEVQLTENQTLKVKAVSFDNKYDDSDFSAPQTYYKNDSTKVELSFYAVNDLHGKFMDTDSQPGVDEMTAYLKDLYADNSREEILLSSGDMWQGTVESSTNRGQLMTEWMNEVGFSSMTLGNHEYDWGADVLMPNSELAHFPFLAINVTYNGKAVEYCQASTIVEKGGLRIGIIGAIGDCLSSISGEFTDGLRFATNNALTSLVKAESTKLRNEEGCDFIVYSIHDGGSNFSSSGINSVINSDMSWYDSALSDGYVDLVFEGHTHQSYILKDEYGVYHLQGGGENKYISCADVTYDTVTNQYTVTPRLISKSVYASIRIEGDPVVKAIFNKHFPDNNPYTTVLGTNNYTRWSDEICYQVAKLYFEKGVEVWGDEYDIVLGGGYLKTRSPYDLAAGNVTYAELFSLLPFDNEIVLGKIKGSVLKERFIGYYSNYHRYTDPTFTTAADDRDYYIIVDSYTSTYAPNRITEVARLGSGTYARDLLAEFVSSGGWGLPRIAVNASGFTYESAPIYASLKWGTSL